MKTETIYENIGIDIWEENGHVMSDYGPVDCLSGPIGEREYLVIEYRADLEYETGEPLGGFHGMGEPPYYFEERAPTDAYLTDRGERKNLPPDVREQLFAQFADLIENDELPEDRYE